MQIKITQSDIEAAIRNHVVGAISIADDKRIDIEFQQTRGDEGLVANVSIVGKDAPLPEVKVRKKPGRRSKAELEAAANPTENAAETTQTVPAEVTPESPVEASTEAPVEGTRQSLFGSVGSN